MLRVAASVGVAVIAFALATTLLALAVDSEGSRIRIVALGDSLTVRGAESESGWLQRYRTAIEQDFDGRAQLAAFGVGGTTSTDLRASLRPHAEALGRADIVTVQIGINDFIFARNQYLDGLCGGADSQDCLREMVQRFHANWSAILDEVLANTDGDTIVQTMDIYYPMSRLDRAAGRFEFFEAYLAQLNDALRSEAAARGVGVARVHAAFNGNAGELDPSIRGLIINDVLHPSDEGHAVIAAAFRALLYIGSDRDSDAVSDATDNCPDVSNADQQNRDTEPIYLPPPIAFVDATRPTADAVGDACDPSTHDLDTDGDRVHDEAERRCGTGERDNASFPAGTDGDADGLPDSCEAAIGTGQGDADSDDDGVPDGPEALYWATDPQTADSDGDGCDDNHEIASVNGDRQVNAADVQQLASRQGSVPDGLRSFDMDGDGQITAADVDFVRANFGSCDG